MIQRLPLDVLPKFGSAEYPLRPSALQKLLRCPMQAVLEFLKELEDTSGAAAQTGSVVHEAIAEYHRHNADVQKGLDALGRALQKYPLADRTDARLYFTPYANDPRNAKAEVTHVELPVRLVIDDIVIDGTLDQIRREHGIYKTFDPKTGVSIHGWPMIHAYALQLSAYTLAARQTLNLDVQPGALIVMQEYRRRSITPEQATPFFYLPWTADDCMILLDRVVHHVHRIRAGLIDYGPDVHCAYCPAGGLANCVPMGREIFGF